MWLQSLKEILIKRRVITQAEQPGFEFRLSFFSSFSHKSPSGIFSACVNSACVRHMEVTEVVVVQSY